MVSAVLNWLRAEHGNIAPLIALTVVPVVGAFAIASETGSWWTFQRAQQNAADSAVVAAAIKGATSEGNVVATKYGYTDGVNNATVSWTSGTTLCPTNVSNLISGISCYQVVINKKVPLYLAQIVGFKEAGTVIGTSPAKTISAGAIAGTIGSTIAYCLGANSQIVMNGGGNSNSFQGCSMIAATSMTCNGGAAPGVLYGVSPSNPGSGQGVCGTPSTTATYTDPYHDRVVNGLSHLSCTGATQAGGNIALVSAQQGGTACYTGDVTVPSGGATVTGANTVIRISNGSLVLSGPLSTSGSGTLTVVFDGTATTATKQNGLVKFANGGSLNAAAPSSGDWDNMVLAVSPSLGQGSNCTSGTSGGGCPLDITISGNGKLYIAGVIYDPNGTLDFNGTVSTASSSTDKCIILWGLDVVGNGNEGYGVPTPGKDCYNRDHNTQTVNVVALLK
jgi:hypothetical protein